MMNAWVSRPHPPPSPGLPRAALQAGLWGGAPSATPSPGGPSPSSTVLSQVRLRLGFSTSAGQQSHLSPHPHLPPYQRSISRV